MVDMHGWCYFNNITVILIKNNGKNISAMCVAWWNIMLQDVRILYLFKPAVRSFTKSLKLLVEASFSAFD